MMMNPRGPVAEKLRRRNLAEEFGAQILADGKCELGRLPFTRGAASWESKICPAISSQQLSVMLWRHRERTYRRVPAVSISGDGRIMKTALHRDASPEPLSEIQNISFADFIVGKWLAISTACAMDGRHPMVMNALELGPQTLGATSNRIKALLSVIRLGGRLPGRTFRQLARRCSGGSRLVRATR